MNKKVVGVSLVILALIIGATAASVFGWQKYQDAKVIVKAKQMHAKIFNEETPREDREKMFKEMRESHESMSQSQQRVFREQMHNAFRKRMMTHLDEYFAMSEEEKLARLDEDIQRQEERRKEWAARRAEREKNGESGKEGGQKDGRAGRGGKGGPGGGRTTEDRRQRRDEFRRMIGDKTTPEQRAKFQAYREAMRKRREELGLPARGGWGRPGGHHPRG